jgi:hypothetical protein
MNSKKILFLQILKTYSIEMTINVKEFIPFEIFS